MRNREAQRRSGARSTSSQFDSKLIRGMALTLMAFVLGACGAALPDEGRTPILVIDTPTHVEASLGAEIRLEAFLSLLSRNSVAPSDTETEIVPDTVLWEQVAGQGTLGFDPPDALSTLVTASQDGIYGAKLTVTYGRATSQVLVIIEVTEREPEPAPEPGPTPEPTPGPSPEPEPEPEPAPPPQPAPEPTPEPEPTPTPPPVDLFTPPAATLYASPNGSGSANGRSPNQAVSVQRAVSLARPGDVIYLAGGVYPINTRFSTSGTASAPIVWSSAPGEWAIFDGSSLSKGQAQDRVWVEASYNVFMNFEVREGPQQGIFIRDASNNVFRNIVTHGHHGSGIQSFTGDRNRFEYVVSYDNFDRFGSLPGENADGISLSSGHGHVVYRSVAFNNSDDGIDAWLSTNTLIDSSISYSNGRGSNGNGNGFKAGGKSQDSQGTVIRNSIAYNNRAHGFDSNSGRNITFYNNTAYNNGSQAFVGGTGGILRNNIAAGSAVSMLGATNSHNSWNLGISNPGFVSTNTSDAGFLSLSSSSPARNVGINVGLDFVGSAPDLGAIPFGQSIADRGPLGIVPLAFVLDNLPSLRAFGTDVRNSN